MTPAAKNQNAGEHCRGRPRGSLRAVRRLTAGIALTALLAVSVSAVSQESEAGNVLRNMEFVPLSGERLQIVLELAEQAPEPISFTIGDPARIALDLPNTRNALEDRFQEVNVGLAQSVNTAEAGGRTRVVVNLAELVPYTTRVEGNRIIVALNGSGGPAGRMADAGRAGQQGEAGPAAAEAGQASAETSGERKVETIDFRRGEEGQGRVIVRTSRPARVADVSERGGKTVVTLKNTRLPDDLVQRLNVLDFATPVKFIDAMQENGDTRLVITPRDQEFERLAYQSDEVFTVEFRPVTEAERRRAERQKPKYTGERITLNFQDVEVRSVLQILADVAGINMVVSDSVSGSLALRLENVPWDQALDIILQSKGLDKTQEGNVMFVAPAEEIAARRRQELESRQQIQKLAPLRSEFIQVNYAKASEIASLLKSGDASLLSDRGQVTVDSRTNTLLVRETADRLSEIRALVKRLDVPVRQVLIESRVVVANEDFTRDIGVRFGATGVQRHGDNGIITSSGSLAGTDTTVNSAISNRQSTGDPFPVEVPDAASDRLNVNLGTANPAGRIALAILGDDYLLDLELSALQAEGRGEIISSPRVITANQKEASIRQGVEIPFQEATSSGATSVSFKEAVLSLQVTPQITPDDRIVMDLTVSNDTVGENVPSGTGGFIPSIDTREVQTQVLVNNGETVVLGGIYEQTRNTSTTKVPVLGDIPLLGRLFRQDRRVNNKSELLVFVTPKILKEGLTTLPQQ